MQDVLERYPDIDVMTTTEVDARLLALVGPSALSSAARMWGSGWRRGAAGKATLMATGYWWLGLAAGLGSKFLTDHGGAKRERLEALGRAVALAERQAAATTCAAVPAVKILPKN